jgi:alkyl hydroperoxide reductase subunit AhpC
MAQTGGFSGRRREDRSQRLTLPQRGAKALAISVDPVDSHKKWIKGVEGTQDVRMNFPMVADPEKKVVTLYDMIHPEADEKVTVRSVFFIDPNK